MPGTPALLPASFFLWQAKFYELTCGPLSFPGAVFLENHERARDDFEFLLNVA